jgi:NAD(P) transhydrogenase subunit alpha
MLGAMNLFGGFVVTDRMLEMFKTKPKPAPVAAPAAATHDGDAR